MAAGKRPTPPEPTPPEPTRPSPGISVTGEAVESPAAVIPSQGEQNNAADRARGRTAVQVGVPAAIVGIGSWLAAYHGLDLDPLGPGRDLPADVAGYFVAVLTVALAFRMNPKG